MVSLQSLYLLRKVNLIGTILPSCGIRDEGLAFMALLS